jgi:hypothetical protein
MTPEPPDGSRERRIRSRIATRAALGAAAARMIEGAAPPSAALT